ncbi:P2Y purinoceptor 8-like [Puntigrus tetrazona]|uniref:P2Y purinoceptor 8-like n=1 Tax=Puntigrus tetrazona TaxID=1606681 RepID=UPI001C89763F|nr:P2Y purinoceptor 8-like [Puntigrus tetrazona]
MSEGTNISTCMLSIFARNSSECHNLPFPFIVFSISINLILGFPAHCYIVWLSMKEMIRGQSPEVFIFNSSLVEVIFNFCFPFVIKQYFFHCSNCKTVALGFGLFLLVGRPLFQTCICAERYLGVLHPVTFLKLKPIKYRFIICVIGWILIICSCLLSTMGLVDIFDLLLPQYLIFFITEMLTCLMVLKALRRPGPSDNVKQRDGVNRDKVKAFRIIQIVLVSSLLTYGVIMTCLMVLKALRRPGPSDNVKQRDGVNRDKVKAFRIIQIVLVSSLLTF